jgi:hypothetical protein
METDLFADLYELLKKNQEKLLISKEIWVFSIWIKKNNTNRQGHTIWFLTFFLGFEPVTRCFYHLEDRI